jgi:hypothetical protein
MQNKVPFSIIFLKCPPHSSVNVPSFYYIIVQHLVLKCKNNLLLNFILKSKIIFFCTLTFFSFDGLENYCVFHRFWQAKFAFGGSISSSSQFLLLP